MLKLEISNDKSSTEQIYIKPMWSLIKNSNNNVCRTP